MGHAANDAIWDINVQLTGLSRSKLSAEHGECIEKEIGCVQFVEETVYSYPAGVRGIGSGICGRKAFKCLWIKKGT